MPSIEKALRLFQISDEDAMARVRDRDDPIAFTTLVRRWEPRLHRLCARIVGDPHAAEDVAQEVFARVFTRRKDHRSASRFSTWIWRIALNASYDELRRSSRARAKEAAAAREAPPDGAQPASDGPAETEDEADRVRRAVGRLPEIYRTVIVLKHYEALTLREIAEVLDVAEGTVASRLAVALDRLRWMLEGSTSAKDRKSAAGRPPKEVAT